MFEDKRLEYRVMCALKEHGFSYIITNDTIDCSIPVLSDVPRECNAVVVDDELVAVRRVITLNHGKRRFTKVIVGIDPGPRPGLAVIGDGKVLEKIHLRRVDEVKGTLDSIARGYEPERMIVRVGNGDIVHRNRIVNAIVREYTVELVDEKNTTTTITNRDVEAAKNIAFTRGRKIRRRVNTVIKDGYLREIQRKSRIMSNGKITISRSLARMVATGELTLEQAIERMEERR